MAQKKPTLQKVGDLFVCFTGASGEIIGLHTSNMLEPFADGAQGFGQLVIWQVAYALRRAALAGGLVEPALIVEGVHRLLQLGHLRLQDLALLVEQLQPLVDRAGQARYTRGCS